jgi:hypothetical protein
MLEKIAHMDGLELCAGRTLSPRGRAIRGRLDTALGKSPSESPLADLHKAKRKIYEHFFSLIYECSADRAASTASQRKSPDAIHPEPPTI